MRVWMHTSTMGKPERQKLILDLIASRSIGRQDEISSYLLENGFQVTQASISRDLDEIGVVKQAGRYAQVKLDPRGSESLFGVSAIAPAGQNLLVVRCSSGLASAAAVRIDAEKIEQIVGTIAGDDTIFVAVESQHDQKTVVKKLKLLFAAG